MDIRRTLDKIAQQSVTLNGLCDALNALVLSVEKELRDCSLGITAEVGVYREGRLAYCRCGDNFRIAVVAGDDDPKPWSDCTRVVKLQTVSLLPALIAQLHRELESLVKSAQEIVASAQGWFLHRG